MKRITLKIQPKRLKLNSTSTNRKSLSVSPIFKDKEEILKVLNKCRSYCSNHEPLNLKSKTFHTVFESHLKSFNDLIFYESVKIKEIQFDKTGVLLITHSSYTQDDFYILFSIDAITSYRKNKGGN